MKIKAVYKADHGRSEVVTIHGLREAFSRKKTAKITFEEFEDMTSEVLGEQTERAFKICRKAADSACSPGFVL